MTNTREAYSKRSRVTEVSRKIVRSNTKARSVFDHRGGVNVISRRRCNVVTNRTSRLARGSPPGIQRIERYKPSHRSSSGVCDPTCPIAVESMSSETETPPITCHQWRVEIAAVGLVIDKDSVTDRQVPTENRSRMSWLISLVGRVTSAVGNGKSTAGTAATRSVGICGSASIESNGEYPSRQIDRNDRPGDRCFVLNQEIIGRVEHSVETGINGKSTSAVAIPTHRLAAFPPR